MTEITPKKLNPIGATCQRVFDEWLCLQYPTVFNTKKPIPLAIGTSDELNTQLPDNVTPTDFKAAMAWYCRRTTYQRAMLKNSRRINLQGELGDEVTENDRRLAQERVDKVQQQIQQQRDELDRIYKAKSRAKKKTKRKTKKLPKPIEVTEPMQSTEEIKPKKLVLKRKVVEPTAEVTPVKAEPTPVRVPNSNVAIAKGLKVTMVIEPASIPVIDSTGKKTITLTIQVANTDIKVTTSLSSKSYRKAMNSIEELGADGCNAILQGAMKKYGVIEDAGLVVQPKKVASSQPEKIAEAE